MSIKEYLKTFALHVLWTFAVAVIAWHVNDYYQKRKTEITNFHLIEQHQREIFCEQAVAHGLLMRCQPDAYVPKH